MPDLKELQSCWRYKTNLHKKKKARQIGSSVWVGGTGHGFIGMASHPISVHGTKNCTFTQPAAGPVAFQGSDSGIQAVLISCLHLPVPCGRGREGELDHLSAVLYEAPPLAAHWPELVTWPQTNCKEGWEMGAT